MCVPQWGHVIGSWSRGAGWAARFIAMFAAAPLIGWVLPTDMHAQTLRFRHYSVDEGLPSSHVSDIVQDQHGFIWLATGHGVARFDGHRFDVYSAPAGDPNALPRELVDQLTVAPDGTVWAVTEGGISRFRTDRDAFESFPVERLFRNAGTKVFPVATRLHVDSSGTLWLGTSAGLHRVDTTTWHAAAVPSVADTSAAARVVTTLLTDRDGTLLVGTRDGLWRLGLGDVALAPVTLVSGRVLPLTNRWIRALAFDRHGQLWMATQNGVSYLDSARTRLHALRRGDSPAARSASSVALRVARLWPDRVRDGMWIGTENGGLDYYSIRRDRFEHHGHDSRDPSSLRSNSVWALTQDAAGMLWVGTFSGGVSATLPYSAAIRGYASVAGDPTSLSYNAVTGFHEDANGDVWIATDGGGLNRFNPSTEHFERFSSQALGIPVDAILSVAPDRGGDLWIGTWGGGVVRVDPRRRTSRTHNVRNAGLTNDNVYEVIVDRYDRVWAGTDDGYVLQIGRRSGRVEQRFDVVPAGVRRSSVLVLREAGDGLFAIALRTGSVVLLDVGTGEQRLLQDSAQRRSGMATAVRTIAVEGDSVLWIGSESGLDRAQIRTGTIAHIGTTEGLPSRLVRGVAVDAENVVWISSDRGITRYDPRTGAMRTLTRNDGLTSNEFVMRAAYRAGDGRLYFGGNSGFTVVDPRRLPDPSERAQVVFTHLSVLEKSALPGASGSPISRWMPAVDTLRLRYDQRMVQVYYSALNYGAPERTQYEYRLGGFEEQWQPVGTRNSFLISSLPAGSYTLQVRAMNDNGTWSDRPATLAIEVAPPFWGTWWFRTLVGVLCGVLLWRLWTFQQQRQVEQALARQALRDLLTGLANRLLFEERVASALARTARANGIGGGAASNAAGHPHKSLALLFIDLDNFKTVNDTHGHHAGDMLLRAVSARLLDATRGSDTVARFGGDEFAVLLEDVADHDAALIVANRIAQSVARPIQIGTDDRPQAVHVGTSIGIAFGDGAQSVEELMRHADMAMYEAKHGGKGRHAIFDPVLRALAEETRALEESLPRALDHGELTLLYQPIVDIHTGRTCGAEALLRWRHPERGWISPDRFIPIAEGNGQITRLGAWTLLTACRAAMAWAVASDGAEPFVSVNLSARQLLHERLAIDVQQALLISGLPPSRLLLEITETTMMKDSARVLRVLQALRGLGVRFAVDDFGTGYSSLRYLQQFPVDVLKIDRSFVDQVVEGEQDQAITSMVVALAASLGLQTIAEGIETEEQRAVLERLGANWAQGFLFQRPVPAEMVAELLAKPPQAPVALQEACFTI